MVIDEQDRSVLTKRPYRQRVRAEQVEATRRRIFDAAYELLLERSYDEITLETLAAGADVSVPTLLRHIGSKEGLLRAGVEHWSSREDELRAAEVGDVRGAARLLARRYDELGDVTRRFLGLAERLPAVAELLEQARVGHREWLEQVFAPWLDVPPAQRMRRVAQLFAATEIYVWTSWRTTLRMTAGQAERALVEHLESLVASWPGEEAT